MFTHEVPIFLRAGRRAAPSRPAVPSVDGAAGSPREVLE